MRAKRRYERNEAAVVELKLPTDAHWEAVVAVVVLAGGQERSSLPAP